MANVIETSLADFQENVIEESRRRPVVVDFWAAWCGPCRMLGPVLEKLAGEFQGAFLLAKVDTDANPELAYRFNVRSIPNVKVFKDGAVAGELTGAVPESEARSFLRRYCPSEADLIYAEALNRLKAGREAEAAGLLEDTLREDPDHAGALFELGRIRADEGNVAEARALWEKIPARSPLWSRARTFIRSLEFKAVCTGGGGDEPWARRAEGDPDDLEAHYAHGCCRAAAGDFRGALEEFLHVLKRDKEFRDEAARKAMLTVFAIAGERSPLSEEFRKKLALVLY